MSFFIKFLIYWFVVLYAPFLPHPELTKGSSDMQTIHHDEHQWVFIFIEPLIFEPVRRMNFAQTINPF